MKDLGNYINKTLLPELKKEKKPMIISVFKKQWGFILEKDHNKYYKPYLKALREDVEASKKKDGIKENKEFKKMIDSGYNLFKLSTEQ